MPKMTAAEQATFLDEPGILMRVAVVRDDGSPLVTPIWFMYRDDAIWFTPREKSEWFGCLRRDARVSLCIDEQPSPYRKVLIDGAAELVYDIGNDDAWRELYRDIAVKYVGREAGNAYVDNTINQPRGLYRVPLSGSKVRNWRMPVDNEAGEGIWHDRYYKESDTKF